MAEALLDANTIKSYIAKTGLKQYEFTDALGVNYNSFNNKLNGHAAWVLTDLVMLADYFQCSTDELLGRTEYINYEKR